MEPSSAENASNILGWISIACWIIVYSPQIWENYSLQSGEGLSVAFVLVWFAGDLSNFFGAVIGNLLPTVIILAIYYSVCDIILLSQIYYYRWVRRNAGIPPVLQPSDDEETPLIPGIIPENEKTPTGRLLAQYAGAFVFVIATGLAAWRITKNSDGKKETAAPSAGVEWIVQLFGWTSAVMYLGARIPQIFKNFKTKCEGLSPALFIFAMAGNSTYALSIFAASFAEKNQMEYLIRNAGWLAGSTLTVFLDVFVVSQFFYYRVSDSLRPRNQ